MKPQIRLLCLTLAATCTAVADPALQTSAYRNSIAQDEIRRQAEAVRVQLAVLLEDIQQNQLNTPEFVRTRDAITRLSRLEDEQILPLVQMLRDAGTMEEETEVQGRLVEASKEQKQVSVLLKGLSDTLNLHKDEASMQQRLEQLALRQTTNLRQTRDVAAAKRPQDKLSPELAALAAVAQAEQAALKTELDLARGALERVVAAVPEAQKPAFAAALEELNRSGAAALAEATAADLGAGDFSRAAEAGEKLRAALESAVRSFHAARPADERLRALAERMQNLSETQNALGEATKKAGADSRQELREAQRKLADELAVVQEELKTLNASAAAESRAASEAMEKAAQDLAGNKELKSDARKQIAEVQEEAGRKLAAAGAELGKAAETLARNTPPRNAAQAAAALAQLSSEIAQAHAQAAAPDSPPRQGLADRVAELQQKALPLNTDAARNLGEAAARLAEQNAPAAAQSLAEANAQIQQQAQAVARAAVQQQALQAVSNQVAAARAQASQARQTLQGTEGNQSAAIKQMESAQSTLQQAQQMAGGASLEVRSALQQAQQALNASKLNAAQMKKSDALAANARAQENLQQAMQSINRSMAGAMAQAMPTAPSSPSDSGPSEAAGQNPDQMAQDGSSGGGMAGDPTRDAGRAGDGGTLPAGPVRVGLRPAERAAVAALQKEKAPAEYQAMAQQYWKNLASGVSPGTPVP